MKLSKNSKLLISFFMKNNCVEHISQTNNTDEIIKELYKEIIDAYNFLIDLKRVKEDHFYNISIKKITNILQISRPKNFNSNSFPEHKRNHIDHLSLSEISYTFSLFDRKITLHFIVEELEVDHKLEVYNRYVDTIIMWFYILNEYGSKKCSNTFTVFFYFTSLILQNNSYVYHKIMYYFLKMHQIIFSNYILVSLVFIFQTMCMHP